MAGGICWTQSTDACDHSIIDIYRKTLWKNSTNREHQNTSVWKVIYGKFSFLQQKKIQKKNCSLNKLARKTFWVYRLARYWEKFLLLVDNKILRFKTSHLKEIQQNNLSPGKIWQTLFCLPVLFQYFFCKKSS